MTREGLIEVIRNALWRAYFSPEETPAIIEAQKTAWPEDWDRTGPRAIATLAALEAAGVRLVPSEPSRHMLVAAHMVERDDIELTPDEHRAMYAAFVAASPYAPPDSP